MTTIYNISPSFLLTYMSYNGKKELDMEEVFKRLSFEMGGDGKSITKDQLNNYIDKAEKGLVSVDKSKLKALKDIQKNWDTISQGEDSISYGQMEKYSSFLMATLVGNFTATEIESKKSSINDAIYDYLVDYLDLTDKSEVKKSDLASYLSEILSSGVSEEVDSELVDALTNMIASYSDSSTIEAEV